jgi:hypothetical protein
MARDGFKIELAPARGLLAMLFEDAALGAMRIIYLTRGHVDPPEDGPEPVKETGGMTTAQGSGKDDALITGDELARMPDHDLTELIDGRIYRTDPRFSANIWNIQ